MVPASSTARKFDAVVIGSGQSGTPLASALAQSGRKTALIERTHIGGCCINEGCTPTKTMIASGRVAHLASRAADYGVWQKSQTPAYSALRRMSQASPLGFDPIQPRVDMTRVRERKREIVESFRGGSERRLKVVEGLEVIRGDATFTGKNSIAVSISGGEKLDVESEAFFINVGERPAEPRGLQGLDQAKRSKYASRILDSTSIMELSEVPEKLIVMGGGYIGMEFGQLFRRLGSEVVIVQRGKQLLPREDAEIVEAVKQIVEEDGIEVMLNATTRSIEVDEAEYRCPISLECSIAGKPETIEVFGSHILLAPGRTPNTDTLGLEHAGVETDSRGYVKISPNLQTSNPQIYALGDCHGGPAFTHISYDDFRIIKMNFVDKGDTQASLTDRLVPYVCFMDPQLGHVGLHEAEARQKYPDKTIKTATMPMAWVARALEVDETRGMMKAVVDGETEQILGFTCLGIEGGELMGIVQVAMMGQLPYTKLQNAVFAHPTLAESLNNLWGYLK